MPISRILASEQQPSPEAPSRRAAAAARGERPARRFRLAPRTAGALIAAAGITLATAPVAEALSAVVGR